MTQAQVQTMMQPTPHVVLQPQNQTMVQQIPVQAQVAAVQPQNQVIEMVPLSNQKPPQPMYAVPAATSM